MTVVVATVWICDNCGAYYAASTAGDLAAQWNTKVNTSERTFPRSQCPTPSCAAAAIERRPVAVKIPLLELPDDE